MARLITLSIVLLAPLWALAEGGSGTAFEVAEAPSEVLSSGDLTALYAYAGLGIVLAIVFLVIGGRLSARGSSRLDEIEAELSSEGAER